jgi:PAS domain S-box-containing protein
MLTKATSPDAFEILREQQLAALDASIDGLGVFNENQKFVYLNEAHARIYGYEDPKELIGKSWTVLYDRAELDRFEKWIMPSFWESGNWRGEAIGTRKDGTRFPQEVSLSSVRGGGLVCVVRDITKRKRSEQRQLLITEVVRSLADSMNYADTIGNVSTLLIPKFGCYSVLQLNPSKYLPETKVAAPRTGTNSLTLEKLKAHPFQFSWNSSRLVVLDKLDEKAEPLGQLGIRSYVTAPLTARGTVLGVLTVLRTESHPEGSFTGKDFEMFLNICDRAAVAIDNCRLFQDEQEAARLQENLLAAVSHDLKNPLTSIAVNTEILGRLQLGSASPIHLENQLKCISNNLKVSVDQMSSLVHQLLEFKKMQSGKIVLEKQDIHVSYILDQLITIFGPLSEKREIRLETRVDPSARFLSCDPPRIMQVLSNLLSNALKFNSEKGRVTVEILAGHDEVIFHISDVGIGIPDDELDHVFKLYWQSSRTSSQGYGLGLAIAKGIVEAHGGRIWAKSEVGRGSTFSFSIPSPARTN